VQLSKNGKTVIGIMGLGVVGDAAEYHFVRQGYALRAYDPGRGLGTPASINEADIVFICVPTPYRRDVGFDGSALENAIGLIEGSKVVVIKSTVLPGTTEALQGRFTQHAFLFNPEFLRQATARDDFLQPDRQIVGYTAQSRHLAEGLLRALPHAPYTRIMPAREAELSKYMTNAFLALKVTFANELFDLASALDTDYNTVRDAVAADARIGGSHLGVLDDGYRGYGGKCLPKDTKALLDLSERMGVPLQLLHTADRVNDAFLPPNEDAPAPRRPVPFPIVEGKAKADERAA
jgi:UDPglucose 6-dehydrogenase